MKPFDNVSSKGFRGCSRNNQFPSFNELSTATALKRCSPLHRRDYVSCPKASIPCPEPFSIIHLEHRPSTHLHTGSTVLKVRQRHLMRTPQRRRRADYH